MVVGAQLIGEKMTEEYERGWQDAFKAIADYVEQEVCPITGQMIRRMKTEKWREMKPNSSRQEETSDPPSEAS